ncbi:PTC1 Serine/threonine protein phosphatase [Flavobacteriaceae bacterium]
MKLIINTISDIGNVRQNNEDMILVGNEFLRDASKSYEFDFESSEHPFLIAIADGMGGHKGGAYASEIVLTEMNKVIRDLKGELSNADLKDFLNERITAIHTKLLDEGAKDVEKTGMGSTFVGILFFQNSIFLINIGDSRLYRFREGILTQLSRDHSLSEMTNNPDAPKNIIVNSFGAGQKIFFDFEDISQRILHNDKILLCSDGLNSELTDDEIESLISDAPDPIRLVDAAKNKEGKDNVSVIIIHYKREE